ncbi:MAG: cytochrome c [Myxococcota bacterium]
MARTNLLGTLAVVLAYAAFAAMPGCSGCRGWPSSKPPVHPNLNMDSQPKYKPYGSNHWFADGRNMRHPPAGTVARGQLHEDEHFYKGMVNGKPADTFPAKLLIDEPFLRRGQERYDISCAICHDHAGGGKGMVGRRLTIPPPTFHSDYMRSLPLGHLFDVISNGIRTMPAYSYQISAADRWAIAAYVQALQLSQANQISQANQATQMPKRAQQPKAARQSGLQLESKP